MAATIQNEDLINHLQMIAHMFLKAKDQWRSRAFSKVAGELALCREPVFQNGQLVRKIPGVGKAINDVIHEFAETGTSRKLEKLKEKLPNEVFERFDARVAKRKVSTLLKPLTEAGVDWGYAGSMRRGMSTVKDVDVIVCLNDESERQIVYDTLAAAGLEADVRDGQEKIGVSIFIKSQGRAFTLDLNFCYPEYRGAMYLYFTGPKAFNISQRHIAKEKGLRLNQKGLWRDSERLAGRTEKEMFEALGMEYLEPNERA